MRMIRFTLAALTILGLTGCEQQITNANLRAVREDMTSKEVESILGQPTKIEQASEVVLKDPKSGPVTHYIYEQDGRKVTLTFVGDRLSAHGIDGNFGK